MKKEFTPNISQNKPVEFSDSPEKLIISLMALPQDEMIGGIGESFIASIIQEHIPNSILLESGQAMRALMNERARRTLTEDEFKEMRNSLTPEEMKQVDGQVDQKFSELVAKASQEFDVVIVASKIFSILAANTEDVDGLTIQEAEITTIAVMTNSHVAIERMAKRQIKAGNYQKPTNAQEFTDIKENVETQRRERYLGDQKIYSSVYPQVECLNPYQVKSILNYTHLIIDNTREIPSTDVEEYGMKILQEITKEIPQLTPLLLKDLS